MKKSVRVRVQNLEYPLRVEEEDEAFAHEVAAYVDDKIERIRHHLPGESAVTTTILAALGIAEELLSLQREATMRNEALLTLNDQLAQAFSKVK